MECPACHHQNAATAKFCNECGGALAAICLKCSFSNSPGAKFCNECGSKIEGSRSAGASSVPVQPRSESAPSQQVPLSVSESKAERRRLTVMFCDLVDSTSLSARLDPEDLRDVITEFQTVTREAVTSFGGHVAQHLGDGLLIYFGYPVAHEDAATRAVHAGLRTLAQVRDLSERMAPTLGVAMSVRIGIHSGPTVVGEVGHAAGGTVETLAIGETPNVAARLQGLAPHNSVVLSEETVALLRGGFHCAELGEFEVKGFAEPRTLYRVLEAKSDVADEEFSSTEFVGRQAQMSALQAVWQQVEAGQGHSAIIRGGAGVGKSRLLGVFINQLMESGAPLLRGRCSPFFKNSAMHPIRQLLEQFLELKAEHHDGQRLERIGMAVQSAGLPDPHAVALLSHFLGPQLDETNYPQPALTPQVRKGRTDAAIQGLFLSSALAGPSAIVVEDLHWVDHTSLEFLLSLAESSVDQPLLVLTTARPEFERPHRIGTEISLNELSRAESLRVIASVEGSQGLPEATHEEIAKKADGNPLFLEELTRMVLDARHDQPTLVSGTGLAIPSTLHDSLMARLDRLEPDHRSLIQLCATIGREFSYALLKRVLNHTPNAVDVEPTELTRGGLLYQRGVPPEWHFAFKHALVQDVAYESLLRRTRMDYHQTVAQALLDDFPDTAPEMLAHHLAGAGRFEESVRYWLAAGGAALGQFALAESLHHLSHALELLDKVPESSERATLELEVRLTYGVPLMLTQGFAARDVGDNYSRMLELCGQLERQAVQLKFAALYGLWQFQIVSARYDRASEMAERLEDLAKVTGDTGVLLAAHMSRGAAVLMLGDFDRASKELNRGLEVYDAEKHAPLAQLFGQDAGAMCAAFLTWAHLREEDTSNSRRHAERAVEIATRVNQPSTWAFVGVVLGTWHCALQEYDQAKDYAERVMNHAQQEGMPHWASQAQCVRGWAVAHSGEPVTAAVQVQEGIAGLTAIGTRASLSFYYAGKIEALLVAGNPKEAREALDEAQKHVLEQGERVYEDRLKLLEARVLLAEGDVANARALLQKLVEEAPPGATAVAAQAAAMLREN